MVKDEADTIGGWITHAVNQGADVVSILDNGSSDATYEIAAAFREALRGHVDVLLARDTEVGYYQSRKVSGLVDELAVLGLGWIVPADADELWHAWTGGTLAEFFRKRPKRVGIVDAQLLSHFATGADPDVDDPFKRLRWRTRDVAPLPKVAFRCAAGTTVHQGNHGVTLSDEAERQTRTALTVRHFPYRTFEQFVRKVRNGAAAYAAAPDLPAGMGEHWRAYGRILDDGGEDALHDVWAEHFWYPHPAAAGLVEDPAPYVSHV